MCFPRTIGDSVGTSSSCPCVLLSSCCARSGYARGTAARSSPRRRDRKNVSLQASPQVIGNPREALRFACMTADSETHAGSGGTREGELGRGAGQRLEVSNGRRNQEVGMGAIVGIST